MVFTITLFNGKYIELCGIALFNGKYNELCGIARFNGKYIVNTFITLL